MKQLMPAKDAARALHLTYDSLLRKVRKNQIKATRVGYAVVFTHQQFMAAQKKIKCS